MASREVRSIDELWQYLDEESSWRKHEITTLLGFLSDDGTPQGLASLLRRAAPLMLYAHWEGFVRNAGEGYLNLIAQRVNRRRIAMVELSPHFRALAMFKGFKSETGVELMRFVKQVRGHLAPSATDHLPFSDDGLIDVESNLDRKRFHRLAETINVDVTRLDALLQVLDNQIVAPRHSIAHGGRAAPEIDEFIPYTREVVRAIDHFKEIVLEAALEEVYLVPTASASA